MQCIYSYTVFILYLLDKFIIYFGAIYAEIIQMYLFSIQCKFYCIYTTKCLFYTCILLNYIYS